MRIGVVAAAPLVAALLALASCETFTADATPNGDAGGSSDGAPGDAQADAAARDGDASSVPLTYPATVLADGPLLYYRLGEHTTTGPAVDLSPSMRNAEFRGNLTANAAGAIAGDPDTAFRFDGMSSAVVLADGPTFAGNAPYTMEAWVRPTTTNGGRVITGCQSGAGGGWAMFFDSDPRPIIERQLMNLGDRVQGGTLPANAFAHLVGTFDGTTQRLYVDGEPVNSAASGKQLPGPAGVPFAIGANGTAAQINFFEGDIDEVAIYDHVLTAARIRAHHQVGIGAAP